MKPGHICARSGFKVATHDSNMLSGIGVMCLAHRCFWWQSTPWQRVMSLSIGTLQFGGDGAQCVAGPVDTETVHCIGLYLPFPSDSQYLIRSSSQGGGED
jgi:hypothetical protein